MMLRRTLLNFRVKTRVTVIGFSLLAICSLLMYRALNSHNAKNHPVHSPVPSLERKESQRMQSENRDPNIPFVNNLDNTFQANMPEQTLREDLLYANLIPKEFETLQDRDLLSADSREALTNFLRKLYPTNWAVASETDEEALDLKHLLVDYGFDSNISCKQIDSLSLGGPVSHSGSKLVDYAFELGDETRAGNSHGYGNNAGGMAQSAYIIRSSSSDLKTKIACMKQIYDADLCATMGGYRFLREVLLLTALRHPNILIMYGYCLRGNRISSRLQEKGLIIVTEVGTPVTTSLIRDYTWSQRVSMALQVGHLLQYLDTSAVGSLRFQKLSLHDFVLVRGTTVKLADLDDLMLGDKACSENSQCEVPDTSRGNYCKNGFCEGLNHRINFHMTTRDVFRPMLENPPGEEGATLLNRLRNMDISLAEFLAELKILFNKSKSEDSLHDAHGEPVRAVNDKEPRGQSIERQHIMEGKPGQPGDRDGSANLKDVLSHFIRFNHRNFAGIYDYQCPHSRVIWGCVHTVSSLLDAASLCLHDHLCQCFVTFSTLPESDNLMTVVLKNETDPSPHSSSGTTLFIRHPLLEIRVDDNKMDETSEAHPEKSDASQPTPSTHVHSCMDRTIQSQELARYNRETRLMAHLGLKGTREQAWRRSALRQNMEGQSQLKKADGGGGRFLANLTKKYAEDDDENRAKKVLFLSEDGPNVYHMAYAVVYHLDRILGLYHTPPCLGKKLTADTVDGYLRSSQWDEMFRALIESDGTLSGIMVAPVPRVMKNIKLTVEPLKAMTSEVVRFTRPEQLQLEYLLLWWLGKIGYQSGDHQGYKEHMIHVYADKAFSTMDLDLSAYLHHCQFPNLVYKLLICFQCDSSRPETADTHPHHVCSLGEEVVKRARAMFNDDTEFFIHNMKESQLATAINSATTSVLVIVDACLQTFGQESVLY